ncbi:MAG: biotin/lipoyl-binding protein, partial [Flavobacteriales bacterium]
MANKESNRKVWIFLGVVLLIVVAVLLTQKNDDILVSTERPTFKDIISTVSASGKIRPESEVKIFSEVNGQVTELLIKEGDIVNSGDLLLKVNPEIYRTALQRADAALSSSRSSLANSKARKAQADAQFIMSENSFKRSTSLKESGAISSSEYESALSQYQVADAEREAAKESV